MTQQIAEHALAQIQLAALTPDPIDTRDYIWEDKPWL
jgi:hypothetical protein